MRTCTLPDGTPVPVLGLGTWRIGESAATRDAEIASVREAITLGYRLIDTAEMYGEGGSESIVGHAIADAIRAGDVRRDELFVVSKVYPHNASRRGTALACDRSLGRLGLDRIDLYLLHWRGSIALAETVEALQALVQTGRIARWGVSNLDVDELQQIDRLAPGRCATDQVYYALTQRGPAFDLLPWMRARSMPMMAYSPIDQGGLAGDAALAHIGRPRGLTAAQVALAWVVSQPGVLAIPKALRLQHLQENLAAAQVQLDDAALQAIDARFPAPRRKTPLAMI